MSRTLFVVALAVAAAGPVGAQAFTVRPVDGGETQVTAAMLRSWPDTTLVLQDHGRTTRFRGVPLRTVLARVGAGPVDSLRGPMLRRAVVLRGADGYAAVIALAELDATLGATPVLVVTQQDGAPLAAEVGPFRAVVPGDGRAARWVRQLVRVEVVALP
jgi:DMSO/TMAO reductase YedYZ molybdopterin-dependent catalytic subunit